MSERISRSRSKSYSGSRSGSYKKRSYTRSRSRSYSRNRYSRSRSRGRRHHSRSRSYSPRRSGRYRSHSRSPMSSRRRHVGNRENPTESRCLGVFGLSLYTEERDLRDMFGKYGPLDDVNVIYDRRSGQSRGFAFVTFRNVDDANLAKERCAGIEMDGRRIRVDFSITQRAHTPTPGIYMGRPTYAPRRRSPSPYYNRRAGGGGGGGRYYPRSRSRSYSRSPRGYY